MTPDAERPEPAAARATHQIAGRRITGKASASPAGVKVLDTSRSLHLAPRSELDEAQAQDRPANALCGARRYVVERFTTTPPGRVMCTACQVVAAAELILFEAMSPIGDIPAPTSERQVKR